MSQQSASDLFQTGDLSGAIGVLNEAVKKDPLDHANRGLLAEFLCIAGELTRADKLFDALGNQDLEAAPGLAMLRQVLRAELARREFFSEGRLPEFIESPTPALEKALAASVELRADELNSAKALLTEAENLRPAAKGSCNGMRFDDLRDADDLTASFLEVLTTTGSYFWVPLESIVSLECHPPQRPRDLIWRRAQLHVRNGPEGEVFLPAIYANPVPETSDQVRLGRITEWLGDDDGPVLGVGQRTFLAGDEARTMMEITELAVDQVD